MGGDERDQVSLLSVEGGRHTRSTMTARAFEAVLLEERAEVVSFTRVGSPCVLRGANGRLAECVRDNATSLDSPRAFQEIGVVELLGDLLNE